MKRRGTVVMGLLVAVVIMPCLAREPFTLATLKARAAADGATSEGQAYLKQLFTNPWRLALDSAGEQCRAAQMRSGSHEEFVIALSIGDNGYPSDALVSPDDEGMRCLADRLKATGFIKPPHDGFAICMPFKRTEPGTEGRPSASVPGKASNR
jgi:hypothetical protein